MKKTIHLEPGVMFDYDEGTKNFIKSELAEVDWKSFRSFLGNNFPNGSYYYAGSAIDLSCECSTSIDFNDGNKIGHWSYLVSIDCGTEQVALLSYQIDDKDNNLPDGKKRQDEGYANDQIVRILKNLYKHL